MKEFKEKEAKISAIGKGNELIKTEVLLKLQRAKVNVESEDKPDEVKEVDLTTEDNTTKGEKRKRKLSVDKVEAKESVPGTTEKIEIKQQKNLKTNKSETNKHMKSFQYKNINYKKFYDDSDKGHKQPKKKCKKHK